MNMGLNKLHKAIKLYFYIHSTDKHDKQNILNLKLVMFAMKCMVSTKLLSKK